MIGVIVASAILSAGVGEGAAETLAKAAEKLAAAESYTFQVTTKSEGGGFQGGVAGGRGPGGGGGAPPGADLPVVGRFAKAKPLHLKRGGDEIFKAGTTSVYKAEDGTWKTVERPSADRAGFGRRRGGDDEGGAGDGGQGEPGEGRRGGRRGGNEGGGDDAGRPRRGGGGPGGQMGPYMLTSTLVPSQILNDVAKKVTDVTSETKDGLTIFSGKLTTDAARELSGSGSRGRGGPGAAGAGGGGNSETTGTFKVTTDASGQIVKIELVSTSKFSFGEDREFEVTRHTSMDISDVGKTTFEIPKDAESQLKMM